jgi:hypothetical protein
VISFAGPLRAARAREAVTQIMAMDASARQAACRSGSAVELVFDLGEQTLIRRDPQQLDRALAREISVPEGVRIEQVRTALRDFASGRIVVRISGQGISRSYAIRLIGPEQDSWLLVAGLSGQIVQIDDEKRVQDILAEASRSDAD